MNTEILDRPSLERLSGHASDVRRDVAKVGQDLKDHASTVAENVKQQATDHAQAVKAKLTESAAEAQDKVADIYDNFRAFAVEHPIGTFGAGIVGGLLVSAWLRRK